MVRNLQAPGILMPPQRRGQIGLPDPDPDYPPSSPPRSNNSGNPPYWWNGVLSLFSQGISAYSGANSGTQVVSSGNRVTAITNPIPVTQQYPPYNADPNYQAYLAQRGSGGIGGSSLGGTADSLIAWATQPTNLVIIAAVGLFAYSWMRDPNKRK